MWGGNVVLEEERERTSMSPANRGLESSAERMEGPRLPEAYRERVRLLLTVDTDVGLFTPMTMMFLRIDAIA